MEKAELEKLVAQLNVANPAGGLSLSRTKKKSACFLVHKQGAALFLFGHVLRIGAKDGNPSKTPSRYDHEAATQQLG